MLGAIDEVLANSELEVSSGLPSAGSAVCASGWQQSQHTGQAFPCRPVQCGVRRYEVADHVPRRGVECPLRRRAHGQRDAALGTKGYAMSCRFLPGFNSHRLSKHIKSHGLLPGLNFAITTKTMHV